MEKAKKEPILCFTKKDVGGYFSIGFTDDQILFSESTSFHYKDNKNNLQKSGPLQ